MVLIDRGRSISERDSSRFYSFEKNMYLYIKTIGYATNLLKNNISQIRKFSKSNVLYAYLSEPNWESNICISIMYQLKANTSIECRSGLSWFENNVTPTIVWAPKIFLPHKTSMREITVVECNLCYVIRIVFVRMVFRRRGTTCSRSFSRIQQVDKAGAKHDTKSRCPVRSSLRSTD